MSISESILPEFDQEMASTRKTLERVPDDRFDWKPHEKSSALGALVTHLSNIPGWTTMTIEQDELDVAPPGEPAFRNEPVKSQQEALSIFDTNIAAARAALAGASDELLLKPWTLLSGGHTILTLPKIAVIRTFVMNHLIHHRAQLGVYLRLNDLPVPSVYGPSADEGSF
ncbi:MAG: DinB family protein [Blastocatellia bacterium]|nr:DinB family protein [Blastocatellia bacterium]